jgi:flagellar M-ring protein FliF
LNQIRELWARLTLRQKISLGLALLVMGGGIYWFVRDRKERDYKPLFTQIAPEDAGQVTTKLKEKAIEYKISEDGNSILVRSANLAELRMEMAAAGFPRSGRIGFEIFDKTNFALTEFAEQVNYQRAMEGELERTINTLREVEHARVHLTFAKNSLFVENRQPAKASVVLKLKSGHRLPASAVQAITFMLSSAVEGLAPEQVSLIDHNGVLLNRPKKSLTADEEMPEMLLEYRQKLERDLLAKVNQTLGPLLGEDKFRAGITVDCELSTAEASEETFDPEKAVVMSEQKTEDISGIPLATGVPGTPSNLPRPVSRPVSAMTNTQRKTESTNYQASRTIRRTKTPQGGIRRISLSVLFDQDMRWEGVGAKAKRIYDVPSPEKVKAIRDVVSAAVGIVAERDLVIVESLPFDTTVRVPAPAAPIPPPAPKPLFVIPEPLLKILPPPLRDPMVLAAVVIGAGLLLLFLGLAVFWFLRRKKKKGAAVAGQIKEGSEVPKLEGDAEDEKPFEERLAEQQDLQKRLEQKELEKLRMPQVTTPKGKILAQHVTDEAKKDPAAIAHVLRTWLHDN